MWHWPDWQSKCTFSGAKQGTELELNKEVYMYLQMGKVKRCGNESMTTFTPPPPVSFFSPLRGKLCCNGLFMCVRGVCLHCMAVRDRFPIFLDGSLSQLGARWRWQRCRERENTPPSVCHLGTKRVPEIKPLEEQMWQRNTHNNIASFSTFVLFGQDWVITINHSICSHTHTPSLTQIHRKSDRHTGKIVLAQSARRWMRLGFASAVVRCIHFKQKYESSLPTLSLTAKMCPADGWHTCTHTLRARPAANNKTCLTSLSSLLISVLLLCCFCESRSPRLVLIFTVCIHKVPRTALYNWELSCDNVWFRSGEVLFHSLLHCSCCCELLCL